MTYPDRALGIILIHATCSVSSVMQYFNDKVGLNCESFQLHSVVSVCTLDRQLEAERFGNELDRGAVSGLPQVRFCKTALRRTLCNTHVLFSSFFITLDSIMYFLHGITPHQRTMGADDAWRAFFINNFSRGTIHSFAPTCDGDVHSTLM